MGKNRKTLDFSWWLQLSKRQIPYVYAERLIRNAEVRGSTSSAPPIEFNDLRQGAHPAFFICHRFFTWSSRLDEIFNCSTLRLGDRSLWFGAWKKGGQRKVADRIVGKMNSDFIKKSRP